MVTYTGGIIDEVFTRLWNTDKRTLSKKCENRWSEDVFW